MALPGLFAEFAAQIQGKHPFPADKLDLLATLGGVLVQNVKPSRALLATVALGKRKADELLPALRSAVFLGASGDSAEPPVEEPPPGK